MECGDLSEFLYSLIPQLLLQPILLKNPNYLSFGSYEATIFHLDDTRNVNHAKSCCFSPGIVLSWLV